MDVQAVAAADLGEAQVDSVLAHKGTAKNVLLFHVLFIVIFIDPI